MSARARRLLFPRLRPHARFLAHGLALGAAACGGAPTGARDESLTLLDDATARAGLDFRHVRGGAGNRELPETMGAGVALFDFDLDGDLDVYLVQSGPVRPEERGERGERGGRASGNALFANDGTGRFERVKGAAGAADPGYGQAVAVGDVDGDGRDDLLALNWGPNALYRNRPNGRFRDTRRASGLALADEWSLGAAFFDMDGDGDLDLYVVNYVDAPPGSHRLLGRPQGFASYPHPDVFLASADRLYRNEGAGRFVEVTREAGVYEPSGKGLGVTPLDVDLDGRLDLYVANDSTPNLLFHNLGGGRFEELGARSGAAFNDDGRTEAGMGVDAADVDEDGDVDLFVTNLDLESNTLYLNESGAEGARFRDRTRAAGLSELSRMHVGFGTLLEDLDGDGHLDLLVVNGHILDDAASLSDNRSYAQPNELFRGNGAGRFTPVPPERAGPFLAVPSVSRGSAVGDLDGDGDPDFVVTNNDGAPFVYASNLAQGPPPPGGLVRLRLAGPPGNPHGLGATVWLVLADGRRLLGRVESARSYASSSAPELFAALPAPLASVEVLWPGGRREVWPAARLGDAPELEARFGTGTPPR